MIKHLFIIAGIIVLIALCMFLSYMPGDYDSFSPTLSFMAQLLCFTGLIMVPIGLAWLTYETIKYRKHAIEPSNTTYHFALVALVALLLLALATSLSVFVNNNHSAGVIAMIIFIYFFMKLFARIKKLKKIASKNFNLLALYLICVPLTILFIRFTFIDKAVEYSRNRAIQKSVQLIKDIEIYHKNNGHYPLSILSVWKDYKTSVIGIKQYHYEPTGKAYNLYFEQVSSGLATKEIVMYNKLNEHEMTSHDQDLLLLSANELNQQRGYFAVYDLPNPHWKRFLFD